MLTSQRLCPLPNGSWTETKPSIWYATGISTSDALKQPAMLNLTVVPEQLNLLSLKWGIKINTACLCLVTHGTQSGFETMPRPPTLFLRCRKGHWKLEYTLSLSKARKIIFQLFRYFIRLCWSLAMKDWVIIELRDTRRHWTWLLPTYDVSILRMYRAKRLWWFRALRRSAVGSRHSAPATDGIRIRGGHVYLSLKRTFIGKRPTIRVYLTMRKSRGWRFTGTDLFTSF